MNPFYIYLWGQADTLKEFLMSGGFVIFTIAVIYSFYHLIMNEELIVSKFALVLSAITIIFGALIPSSKTIAAMVIIPEIAKSKAIQEDLPEIYDMAIKQLKASISEKTEK